MIIRAKYVIIASTYDQAGMNITEGLLSDFQPVEQEQPKHWPEGEYSWYKYQDTLLLIMNQPHYQADFLHSSFDVEQILIASKHISSAKQKAILVHPLGNWGEARHDSGNSYQLAPVDPYYLTLMFRCLEEEYELIEDSEFWVGVEATHHGPTSLDVPIFFVEVGGTEEEWEDKEACSIVTRALIKFIETPTKRENKTAIICLGGGHYAPAFLRRVKADLFYLSHILPKFGIGNLDKVILQEAWDKTLYEDKLLLIDKSGTKSAQRNHVIALAEELGLPYAMTADYPTKS